MAVAFSAFRSTGQQALTLSEFWDSARVVEDSKSIPVGVGSGPFFMEGFMAPGDSGIAMRGSKGVFGVFVVSPGNREVLLALGVPAGGGELRIYGPDDTKLHYARLAGGNRNVSFLFSTAGADRGDINRIRLEWHMKKGPGSHTKRLVVQGIELKAIGGSTVLSSVSFDSTAKTLSMGPGCMVELFVAPGNEARIKGTVIGESGVAKLGVDADGREPTVLWESKPFTGKPQDFEISLRHWNGEKVIGVFLNAPKRNEGVVWQNLRFAGVGTSPFSVDEKRPPRAYSERPSNPLNVILYLVDTVRRDHLQVYGYNKPTTSGLMGSISDWVIWDDCQSVSSWTKASTASLLTGVDPMVHGAIDDDDSLRTGIPLLWETFRDFGYETALLSTNGHISSRWGFTKGIDHYRYFSESAKRKEVHFPADSLHMAFLEWIDDRPNQNRPFFAYLHATDPHIPYTPPVELIDKLYPSDLPKMNEVTVDMLRPMICPGQYEEWRVEAISALYDAEIAAWEETLFDLLNSLSIRGFLEKTVVLITSDHGEEFAEHGGFSHGMTLYPEQLRVPFFARIPGGRGGRSDVSMDLMDVGDLIHWILDGKEALEWRPITRSARVSHLSLRGLQVARYETDTFSLIWNVTPKGVCDKRVEELEMFLNNSPVEKNVASKYSATSQACRGALSAWLKKLPDSRRRVSALDEEMIQRLRFLGYMTDE